MKTYDRRSGFIICERKEFFNFELSCNLPECDWWVEYGPEIRYVGVNYNLDKQAKLFCFKLMEPKDSRLSFVCKNASFAVIDKFEVKVVYDESPDT
jgi:hypothetical protein